MTQKIVSLLVTSFLAVAMHASAQDNLSGNSLNPSGAPDCSDPLMADSSQCTAQYQNQTQINPANPSLPTNPAGLQQPLSSNYTDNEILARQNAARNQQQLLPPAPLTEFQKFVASTTGQVLPIFGANLFRRVPSTFAPLDMVPVPPDYILGPGDELRIRVWGQVNFRADVRIDRSGEIYLPQIGQIHVAGMPFSALDAHLRSAVGRVYHNFDLTADVGQIRAIQVYLAGDARRPGVYTVSSLSTLVDALFASGGPSTDGSLRHIELRRDGAVVTDFDLYALLVHGDKSKDVPLQSGDVIFIPPVGPQVAITGSVKSPALYELRKGESLADAIADAGGASVVADQARISIERIDDHRDRYAMEVNWDHAGLGTVLTDGDLVRVFSIVPKYQNTVTLRGNTANQGRFAWHPGMRISDLIPDKASLITRNYWWKRAQLGLPVPEFEPLQRFPELRQPSTPVDLSRRRLLGQAGMNGAPNSRSRPPVRGMNSDQNTQNYYDQSYGDQNYNNQNYGDQNYNDQNYGDQNYNDQNYGDQNYNDQNYNNQNYNNSDAAAVGANQSGFAGSVSQPPRRPSAAQSAGNASLAFGQSSIAEGTTGGTRTEIGPIAPEIDWNYAVIERMDPDTLKTVLIPFDLGRLVLQHDQSQNLALQAGDVVSILSQADIRVPIAEQTKFVRLDGEFVHAGVYTVHPGETLRDLVRRAGGFTPNAYLYGSEFTRESTRAVQQRRMDEYVQTLEMQMQRGNLALASSPASSAQDLASGAAAQNSERELVTRLSQIRATGRVVLEFKAGSSGLDAIPPVTLENGDRFVVPPTPASINVVGSVYDQNSFLYQPTRRAGAYLRLAGGPNRDADRKHIFVIRADGSVVSWEAESGLWGNEFDNLKMNPGDTIVVPEKGFRASALRGFLDWSQLFSQFALGAAALSIIQ